MSGDPEQEYFADGIVEDLTTAISRLPWLFVIARNSSFTYKGRPVDVKQVARELGVRYVLEGSVRKAGNRVRIGGQLIDTTSGGHIWADRFDGELDDIFALQDQVASSVVGAIEPRLRHSEIERAARKPTENLDAYDLYLRALAEVHKYSEEGMQAALTLLKQALTLDPGYAPAAAMVGFCRTIQKSRGWGPLSDAEIAEGLYLARQALEFGKDDPDVLWMAGDAISALARDHATATVAIDRALKLNPNSANAWMARGWMECNQNHPHPAIEALERAIQLSPLDPLNYYFSGGRAFAHLLAGQYAEAVEWADRCFREQPRFTFALRVQGGGVRASWPCRRGKVRSEAVARAFPEFDNRVVEGKHRLPGGNLGNVRGGPPQSRVARGVRPLILPRFCGRSGGRGDRLAPYGPRSVRSRRGGCNIRRSWRSPRGS